jgi:cytochrome d ubiquinol oxidase subunit I
LWETTEKAPIYIFALPDARNEKNAVQIGAIPGMLSFLGYHDFNAEVKGLKEFAPDERPPVFLSFVSFRIMVALGFYFVLMTIIGMFKRNRLLDSPGYLRLMLYSIPLPFLAIELGWILAEVGRQPWIVYGLIKTSVAASPVATLQVWTTLIAFILVYALLGAVGYFLMFQNARKGPDAVS